MKRKQNSLFFLFVALSSFLFISCEKAKHEHEHEHDEIGSMVLKFEGNGQKKTFTYTASEGEDAVGGVIEGLPEGSYNVDISFLSPNGEDLSGELFGEHKDDHFVFFLLAGDAKPAIKYADNDITDSDGIKLGKKTVWTLKKGESSVTIFLIHEAKTKNANAPSASVLGGHHDVKANIKIKITE